MEEAGPQVRSSTSGRVAQLVRAPALQAGSRGFEALHAHSGFPWDCGPLGTSTPGAPDFLVSWNLGLSRDQAIEHALVVGEIEAAAKVLYLGPGRSVPVRLDPELRAALDERAASDDTTASDVIREALRRYLKVS